jgi:hypothetical protein
MVLTGTRHAQQPLLCVRHQLARGVLDW